MTNTIHFDSVCRDDESVSVSSFSSDQISQLQVETQQASSSLFSVISKAISSWIISRQPGGSSNYEKNYLSSGHISSKFVPLSRGKGGKLELSELKNFSFQELETATCNFHCESVLGEGCFGKVFKGWIDKKTATSSNPGQCIAVAVKRLQHGGSLEWDVHDSRVEYPDGTDIEWAREVEYLGRLYHPNIVRLCGYCSENMLLVYEFMSRGSLDNHLFKIRSSGSLSWSLRMKIALGAAKGLAFLHSAEINVIHRGFKSSDILLDSDYNAKLSDFGLAMDGSAGDDFTGVYGTPGYIAPEYIATGRLSTKSDVYSFGVVLLELLSGRRIREYYWQASQYNLVYWADPSLGQDERFFGFLDQRLNGEYPVETAQIAVKLGLLCVAAEAKSRPNMAEVVTVLEGLQDQQNLSDQEETLE